MPSSRKRRTKKLVVKPLHDAGMDLSSSLGAPFMYEALLDNAQINHVSGIQTGSYTQGWTFELTGNTTTSAFKVLNAIDSRGPNQNGTLTPDSNRQKTIMRGTGGLPFDAKWSHVFGNGPGFGRITPVNFYPTGIPYKYLGTNGFSFNFIHHYMGGTTYTASLPAANIGMGGLCIMSPNQPEAPYVAGINNGQANAPSHAGTTTSGGRPVHRFHIPAEITGAFQRNFEGPFWTQTSLNINVIGRLGDGEQIQIWCSGSTAVSGGASARDGYGKLTGTIGIESARLYSSSPNYQGGDGACWGGGEPSNFDIPTGALPINIVWTGSALGTAPNGSTTAVTTGWQIFIRPTGSCSGSIQI